MKSSFFGVVEYNKEGVINGKLEVTKKTPSPLNNLYPPLITITDLKNTEIEVLQQ